MNFSWDNTDVYSIANIVNNVLTHGVVTTPFQIYGEWYVYEMQLPQEKGGNQYRFIRFTENDKDKIALCFAIRPQDASIVMANTDSTGKINFLEVAKILHQTGVVTGKLTVVAGVTQIYDQNAYTNTTPVRLDTRGVGGPDVTLYAGNTQLVFKSSGTDPVTQQPHNPITKPPTTFIEQINVMRADVQNYTSLPDGTNVKTENVRLHYNDDNHKFLANNLGLTVEYGKTTPLFMGQYIETIKIPKPEFN